MELQSKYESDIERYVKRMGGTEGAMKRWKVIVKRKEYPGGKTKLVVTYDTGKKILRSKPEVARHLGIVDSKKSEAIREVSDEIKLSKWQMNRIVKAPTWLASHVEHYLMQGYTIFKNVLTPELVSKLLLGTGEASEPFFDNTGRKLRARDATQCWQGAVQTINAHIKHDGGTETVLSPATTRDTDRYDIPLPHQVCGPVLDAITENGILKFATHMCKQGKFKTQDIMLSKPGSVEQVAHTDSSWDDISCTDSRVTYLTILIPLTFQDVDTGGTRIWPRSHHVSEFTDWKKSVDVVEPMLSIGDALVFDGLLVHCGMGNTSTSKSDRYFYYAAFSSSHDPNTEVTGV